MRNSLILLAVLIFIESSFGQEKLESTTAIPEIGYDLLLQFIPYPEIWKRAGIEKYLRVYITVDSLGQVLEVSGNRFYSYTPSDSVLLSNIEKTFKAAKWLPGKVSGKPTSSRFSIPLLFYFPHMGLDRVFTRRLESANVKKIIVDSLSTIR